MKKIILLFLVALIFIGTAVVLTSCGKTSLPCSITAYNSSLTSTDRLNILDTLFVGVTGLKAGDQYNIKVIEVASNTEVSQARFTADENGAIPATALWYDIGAVVTTEAGQTLSAGEIDYGLTVKSYRIQVTGVTDTGTDFSLPFVVINDTSVAQVWAADSSGNVKNAFEEGTIVYAYGRNFTPGDVVDIYVTTDKNWTFGDTLNATMDKSTTVETATINSNGTLAAVSVWSSAEVQSTYSATNPNPFDYSYDIVVDVNQNGQYDSGDVVDHILYSGFVVQKPPVPHYKLQIASTGFNYSMYNNRNWGYSDSFKVDGSTLLNIYGSQGIRAIWNPYVYGANPKVSSIYGRYVDIYVTATEPTDVNNLHLTAIPADVSGPNGIAQVERVPVYAGCGNGCWQYIIWPKNLLRVGHYWVVVDVDCNGLYDKTVDILDGITANDTSTNEGFVIN